MAEQAIFLQVRINAVIEVATEAPSLADALGIEVPVADILRPDLVLIECEGAMVSVSRRRGVGIVGSEVRFGDV